MLNVRYYTTKYLAYDVMKKKSRVTGSQNFCGKFITSRKRKHSDRFLLNTPDNLLTEISEIRYILQDEKNDENMWKL